MFFSEAVYCTAFFSRIFPTVLLDAAYCIFTYNLRVIILPCSLVGRRACGKEAGIYLVRQIKEAKVLHQFAGSFYTPLAFTI